RSKYLFSISNASLKTKKSSTTERDGNKNKNTVFRSLGRLIVIGGGGNSWDPSLALDDAMAPATGGGEGHGEEANEVRECRLLERALSKCHRRIPSRPAGNSACRHLNRTLAECLVLIACPY
ncbi:hypothetical protein PanWU01x14_280740, partial [Parasponia andersonii]